MFHNYTAAGILEFVDNNDYILIDIYERNEMIRNNSLIGNIISYLKVLIGIFHN